MERKLFIMTNSPKIQKYNEWTYRICPLIIHIQIDRNITFFNTKSALLALFQSSIACKDDYVEMAKLLLNHHPDLPKFQQDIATKIIADFSSSTMEEDKN